ncbi:MAG: hypothetical protein ACOCVL_02110 [Candidatus Sumerlaeota bacterium]
MASANPEVRYCYRCGKRLGSQHEKCWYCGATALRQIRPPRQCPFCMQELPHNAVKCHHCGEFVDGRATSGAAGSGQTVNFVIDKAVFSGDQALALEAGQDPPGAVSAHLSEQSREAIRKGDPKLLDQDGIQALPAPEASLETKGETEQAHAVTRAGSAPSRQNAAAQRQDVIEAEVVGEAAPPDDGEEDQSVGDAPTSEDRYRICSVCGTEILSEDNYCFHCGTLQKNIKTTKQSRKQLNKLTKASTNSNKAYYAMIVLFSLFIAYAGLTGFEYPYLGYHISTGLFIGGGSLVSLFLLVAAYTRRRILSARIVTTLFALFWLACLFAALFGRAFLGLG